MNQVDTSEDTINAEFAAAEEAIGLPPGNTAESPVIDPQQEADKEAQIAIAKEMINTSLRLSIGLLSGVTVDNKHTEDAAQAYAVLIIKYFPGGIFGLLDRYKEEIAAGTATFMLIRAVSHAKAEQTKEEKKPEDSTSFTKESKGEFSNGAT